VTRCPHLLLSAVLRRRCCRAQVLAARRPQQSIDISSQGAQQQTFRTPLLLSIDGTDGRTDGSTTVT